jgi:hypothetical protein
VHVDALDGRADLAGVRERAARRLLGRPLRVDAGVDDQRVLAAELEQRLAEAAGAGLGDLAARLHRAGVQDEVDAGMRGERAPRAGVAVQELERAARHVEQLDEPRRGQRRLLRRLEDDGVAGHERRRDLPGGDGDRVVPGHDQRHDAARLVDHEVGRAPSALERPPAVQRAKLGVLLDRADAGLDAAERVGDGLAALARLELGQLARVLADAAGAGLQDGRPLGRVGPRPRRGRRAGRADRGVRGLGRARGDRAENLAGGRVAHLEVVLMARGGKPRLFDDPHRLEGDLPRRTLS